MPRSHCGNPATVVSDDLVGEVCRCAAGELHVVAAVVGAIAAQVGRQVHSIMHLLECMLWLCTAAL